MKPARSANPRDYGARWIDSQGAEIGVTNGATVCLFPVKPWRLRARGEDFEHVLRCRWCPGCLEFDRRRQAERLRKKYESYRGPLFLVRIYVDESKHVGISRKLRRLKDAAVEPGWHRLGVGSIGLLVREVAVVARRLRRLGLIFRSEPIQLKRGRRAFRSITGGLLVSRERYGKQVNRWYVRRLPALEKKEWDIVRLPTYQRYHRAISARAKSNGDRQLLPPKVFALRSDDQRILRRDLAKAGNPEDVVRIARFLGAALPKIGRPIITLAPPKSAADLERQREFNIRMCGSPERARTDLSTPDQLPPPLFGGGYVSSEHSSPGDRPGKVTEEDVIALANAPPLAWMEKERRELLTRPTARQVREERAARELPAALERLRKLMEKSCR